MERNHNQEKPLTTSELVFLTLSLGSLLASLHYMLSLVL